MKNPYYTRLFEALDDAGLRTRADLMAFRAGAPEAVNRVPGVMACDDAGLWVDEAFAAVWDLHNSVLSTYLRQKSPKVLAERIYSYRYFNQNYQSDPVIDKRAAYAMLFPSRVLILSHPLVAWPDSEQEERACPVDSDSSASDVLAWGRAFIPYDFLAQAIELRPLLERGMAYLLPRRFTTEHYGENCGLTSTGRDAESETDIELTSADPAAGMLVAAERKVQETGSETDQILALPWLHGANMRETVEVAEEHEAEFEAYLSALGRYFTTHDLSDAALRAWIQEVQYHVDRLHASYKRKETELRWRGRGVALGLCFTVAPLLAPDVLGPVQSLLAAAWAGSTVKDAISWLRAWRRREDSIADSEFWVMWKLARRNAETH